jgi:hypothetical protein
MAMSSFQQGDVISYMDMCQYVGVSLQRGMNFRIRGVETVVLMSRRKGAPYDDQVDDVGRTLIYEGHDCARTASCPNPKRVDQPELQPSGVPTQNGLFVASVKRHKELGESPERVKVFEKIRDGIWVYNGAFELIDYKTDSSSGRRVFKFTLRMSEDENTPAQRSQVDETRIIPSWVKLEVWKRDQGKCTPV